MEIFPNWTLLAAFLPRASHLLTVASRWAFVAVFHTAIVIVTVRSDRTLSQVAEVTVKPRLAAKVCDLAAIVAFKAGHLRHVVVASRNVVPVGPVTSLHAKYEGILIHSRCRRDGRAAVDEAPRAP